MDSLGHSIWEDGDTTQVGGQMEKWAGDGDRGTIHKAFPH